MQHRRHRVGDTLDDYCPRERRLTTHAVVAMVEDDIKQTRCTTCDFEHVYKGAKVPPRRKPREAPAALARPAAPEPVLPVTSEPATPEVESPVVSPGRLIRAEPERRVAASADETPAPLAAQPNQPAFETPPPEAEGSVHRRLIRATLPRTDAQPVVRPVPEFTIRQPSSNGSHRHGGGAHRPRSGGRPAHGFGQHRSSSQGNGPSHRFASSGRAPHQGNAAPRHGKKRPR